VPYGIDFNASFGWSSVAREELDKAADVVSIDVRTHNQVEPSALLCKLRQVCRNEVLVRTREASINKEVRTAEVNKEGITILGGVHFQSKHVSGESRLFLLRQMICTHFRKSNQRTRKCPLGNFFR
jgi:hypothetical protein